MLSLLACALTLGQAPIDQPARLRTVLPNGAIVLIERSTRAKSITLQVFLAARAGGTYAERHLLEHLMAVADGNLDSRLESQGAFLNPRTLRPAICFAFDLPPDKLALGLSATQELLKPRSWTESQITRELRVLRQEAALQDEQAKTLDLAWKHVYGTAGGSAFDVGKPTPASLSALNKALISPDNVTVVVTGNVPLDETTAKVKNALEGLIKAPPLPTPTESKGVEKIESEYEIFAVPVPSFRNPKTAAVLAAALASASKSRGASVTYTPSSTRGLVTILRPSKAAAPLDAGPRDELFRDGKLLGRGWVKKHLGANETFWRGFLIAQERDLKPETLQENLDAMTLEQFQEGLQLVESNRIDVSVPDPTPVALREVSVRAIPVTVKPAAVIELIDPRANVISIQAVVALPSLSASERAILPAIAQALPEGTREYGKREMVMITGGMPVRTTLMPDHIRIAFTVPRDALAPGLSLMSSLVQAPLLKQEDFGGRPIPPDIWGSALRPHFYSRSNATREEVVKVYEQVFRPEHVTLAVGGPLKEGAVSEEWSKRVAAWQPPRMRRYIEDLNPKAFAFASQNATVEGIDFSSAALPNLFPRLLALFALGSGKGSSLFRVVRQQLGLSYRSEAVLTPTETGFNTRLVILAEPGASSERIRGALLKDIDSWKEPERVRALGMAQAVIQRENGFSPFYLSGPEPIVSDFEGRVFMAGYWHMKTGLAWNPTLIIANLKDIPLPELQEAAREIVQATDPRA